MAVFSRPETEGELAFQTPEWFLLKATGGELLAYPVDVLQFPSKPKSTTFVIPEILTGQAVNCFWTEHGLMGLFW